MLGTLTATQIFSRALDFIKKQWKAALLIVAINYGLGLVLGMVTSPISILLSFASSFSAFIWPLIFTFAAISIALSFAIYVFDLLLTIPLYRATGMLLDGANPSFDEGWNNLTVQFKRYFAVSCWQGLFMYLWSLLFIVPGIIKYYEYYTARLLILDYPKLDYKEALKLSMKITDGFKGRLFCLSLLQALVMLAGMVLFCTIIAPIFASALCMALNYYCTVIAYRDIRASAIDRGLIAPVGAPAR